MAIKVTVEANGELYINAEKRGVADLTQDLLEKILDDSLSDEVEFCIEGDTPLAKFFNTIQSETKEGSELRNLKKRNDEALQAKTGIEEELPELIAPEGNL
ncbi:hypothetical protein [Arabiibacter massiliensis]|uniref:hypothetical protein n=1 Tax=Arabiibacter massiliensis TaxID=1870985 RepID=UPI00117B3F2F|nr:hypothetical protein [Arabiibacter massiliensis]